MKFHHIIAVLSVLAPLVACSSSDSNSTPVPAKGGSGGSVVGAAGKGGSTSKAGSGGSKAGSGGGSAQAGTGGSGGGTVSASCDESTKDTAACQACMGAECQTELAACQNNAACKALDDCVTNCSATDASCYSNCYTANGAGKDAHIAMYACILGTCHNKCLGTGCCMVNTNECGSCVGTKCNAECVENESNVDAAKMNLCTDSCGQNDDTCYSACTTKYTAGNVPVSKYYGCFLSTECKAECGRDAASCLPNEMWTSDTCKTCMASNCAASCQACEGNKECVGLMVCISDCGQDDQACLSACETAFPNGVNDLMAYEGADTSCIATSCATQCGATP